MGRRWIGWRGWRRRRRGRRGGGWWRRTRGGRGRRSSSRRRARWTPGSTWGGGRCTGRAGRSSRWRSCAGWRCGWGGGGGGGGGRGSGGGGWGFAGGGRGGWGGGGGGGGGGGFVPFQARVEAVYRALDVVVHASTRPEPFGLTIAEAMACGRPLVAARAGGAAELFEDEVEALGLPEVSAGALA